MEHPLANDKDIKEVEQLEVDFFGRPAFLTRINGKVHAYVNVCMHLGGGLKVEKDEFGKPYFHCTWHGAAFSCPEGKATKGPAPLDSKLVKLPVKVKEDGKIYYFYP